MKTHCLWSILFCGFCLVSGCNSYKVVALPYDANLKDVVVIENRRVIVNDFKGVMIDEFNARNIKVRLESENYVAKPDEYIVRYDARQSWDFSLYLSDATVRVIKDNMTKAKGKYHHIGGSCSLDIFTKWRGTEWKMKEVYDEMLKNYSER